MNQRSEEFKSRTISLTLNIIKLFKKLSRNLENQIFAKQIIRSSSSIGANYQEAQVAHSHKEFIQKLNIALKEANETTYWIELIEKANNINIESIKNESIELTKILMSITKRKIPMSNNQ